MRTKFTDIQYLDYKSWRELWTLCTENTIKTMIANLSSDLNYGYSVLGSSYETQVENITFYRIQFKKDIESLNHMTTEKAERTCFNWLRIHGYID